MPLNTEAECQACERLRAALRDCATIDEAKAVRDRAEALGLYAKRQDDVGLQVWAAEVRLRACVRIGQLSLGLDTAERARTDLRPTVGMQTKAAALAAAGISTSAAHRCEELAGGRTRQAPQAATAVECYFAQARETRVPATMDGLRAAIREALGTAVRPRAPKPRPAEPEPPPQGDAYVPWVAAVKHLAAAPADVMALAEASASARRRDLLAAREAEGRLQQWIQALQGG